jgi:hypothetical protein
MPQTPCLLAAAADRSALAMPRRSFPGFVGAASEDFNGGALQIAARDTCNS